MSGRVAVVPARKGSKGLSNKNISQVLGESLVNRTLRIAAESELFSKIILSTDYSTAELHLAPNPLLHFHVRSLEASKDDASAMVVMQDLMDCAECFLILENSIVCYLQPTSPLRTSNDLKESFLLGQENHSFRVVSVVDKPIQQAKLMSKRSEDGLLEEASEGASTQNRQVHHKEMYLPNGAIYWFEFRDIGESSSFPVQGALAYPMPWSRSIDVDSMKDLEEVREILGDTNE